MSRLKVDTKEKILNDKRLWLSMIIMSLPLFINNFIKSLNGSVDTFFVSQMGLTAEQIGDVIHPHPTLTEGIMEALHDVHKACVHSI